MIHAQTLLKIGAVISALLLSGCASLAFHGEVPRLAYVAEGANEFARHMPVIVTEQPDRPYNRIGRPEAASESGRIRLRINPDEPVVYSEKRHFATPSGSYTNLIYRIHFEKVPFRLLPFHVTAGRNVGLLLIVTLDEAKQPVLITTVHTCGCYLAIVPTRHLREDAFPADWDRGTQNVFGATLPGLLEYDDTAERPVVYLQDETHRVLHMDVVSTAALDARFRLQQAAVEPIGDLDTLPLAAPLANGSRRVSMFEPSGARRDYVRGSYKPFELLFISWWALDIHVGVDKRYGRPGREGRVFYTSLKPWARTESDMRDFPRFLAYWGWRL